MPALAPVAKTLLTRVSVELLETSMPTSALVNVNPEMLVAATPLAVMIVPPSPFRMVRAVSLPRKDTAMSVLRVIGP